MFALCPGNCSIAWLTLIQTAPMELPTLRAELKNEMAPYKIPTVLKVVDGIERNAMGKVNKKVIVQKYWPDKA
jgi:acyl-CoA synthetase (AMP-forming)/AMP-acid ligase II